MGIVKVAVLGCGPWGRNYVRLVAESGQLAYVYDTEISAAHRALESVGLDDSYLQTSWQPL